jgi:hypothetical protein
VDHRAAAAAEAVLAILESSCPCSSTIPSRARLGEGSGGCWELITTSDGSWWLETSGHGDVAREVVRLPGLAALDAHGLRIPGLGTLMNPVLVGVKWLGWTLRDIRSR